MIFSLRIALLGITSLRITSRITSLRITSLRNVHSEIFNFKLWELRTFTSILNNFSWVPLWKTFRYKFPLSQQFFSFFKFFHTYYTFSRTLREILPLRSLPPFSSGAQSLWRWSFLLFWFHCWWRLSWNSRIAGLFPSVSPRGPGDRPNILFEIGLDLNDPLGTQPTQAHS